MPKDNPGGYSKRSGSRHDRKKGKAISESFRKGRKGIGDLMEMFRPKRSESESEEGSESEKQKQKQKRRRERSDAKK